MKVFDQRYFRRKEIKTKSITGIAAFSDARRIAFVALMLAAFIASSFNVAARQRRFDPENLPKIGVVEGSVLDAETGDPMPSVTVYLHRMRDSSVASGALTTPKGEFEIDEVPFGRYYVSIKVLGYEEKIVDEIAIMPRKTEVSLGEIELDVDAVTLEGVEVEAEKRLVEFKVDKKVVNVDKNIVATGGSAIDALENAPSVEVDIEGNISLRGSSSFTVFINGKPSVLDAQEALEQIPATNISHIEIMTNPSAKYDPDGVAGIINVVLKEKKLKGLSGTTDVSVGTRDKYRASGLLEYKTDGWNFFTGFSYRDDNRYGDGRNNLTTRTERGEISQVDDSEMHRVRSGWDVRGGAAYDIDDDTQISTEGKIGRYEFGRDYISFVELQEFDAEVPEFYQNKSVVDRFRDFYSVNADFIRNFNSDGHKLAAGAYFQGKEGGGDDYQRNIFTDAQGNYLGLSDEMIRTTETEISTDIRLKADYTLPFSEVSQFEAGLQARIEPEEETYEFERFDTLAGVWNDDDDYSNAMDFNRNIYSAYAMYGNEILGAQYKLGLRSEYTDRRFDIEKSDKKYEIDRIDLFPTAHVSYKFDEANQAYLSYGRRIDRPGGRSLDPFPVYRDEYNYYQGNPELEPEYINSYELGYQRYFGRSYVSSEIFYRNTVNKINRIMEVQPDGVVKHTSANLNQDHAVGAEISSNWSFGKALNLNGSVSLFQYWIDGSVNSQEVEDDAFQWNGRLNAMYKLTKTTRFQADMFYRAPMLFAQGKTSEMWGVNLGARQNLFDNKMAVSLQVRDVFQTYKRVYEIDQGGVVYKFERYPDSPVVTMSLEWRFNNYKRDRGSMRDENGGDIEIDF